MKIIATAPTRLSLFGGGTDLPVYYKKYGGMVISVAINIRQHVVFVDGYKDPKGYAYPPKGNPDFYKAIFDEFDYHPDYANFYFDATIESGLGSSASAAVATIGAISKAKGLSMTRRNIAEKAWDIEVNKFGLYGGKQDQYAAAIGGMNVIWFDKGVYFKEVKGGFQDYLLKHLILFYTGCNRKSPKIQEELKTLSHDQENALHRIKDHARLALKAMGNGDITELGYLLDEAWECKKRCNRLVTNDKIDQVYEAAKKAGALGGKIMGSGGGGYCFFLARPFCHEEIKEKLKKLDCTWVDFGIDKNGLEVRCEP